jgi:Cd2+/Zn2+-exporting ATPase
MLTTFRIQGLDCAVCGLKIENAIRKLPGVSHAAVDFANLRLHLDAKDLSLVRDEIRRIEPEVGLTPDDARAEAPERDAGFNPKRELGIFFAALVLFCLHALIEERFHERGWQLLDYGIAFAAYFLAGSNIYVCALRTIRKGGFFDENVLMVIATAGAIAIHALSEAVGVMLFFKAGEFLQNIAVARSRRSIRSLLAARPDQANLLTADGIRPISPERVSVGEVILVKPGEKIPLDGDVISGQSNLDTAALTGEPVPRKVRVGDTVMAGMINVEASIRVRVTKPYFESSISKMLELVQNASARKAATEKFITTFARWYTPAVVAAAAGIAVIPPLLTPGADFEVWIYRALVVLVVSCPCALVVSIPLGYFGGIGRASRRGILVKGSNFLDALAAVKTVVFDKTGTLTQGRFAVQRIVTRNGHSETQILEFAALAELHSTHPIGKSILAKATEQGIVLDGASISEHVGIPGKGVQAVAGGHKILVGSDGLLHQHHITHDVCDFEGTAVNVAVDDVYAGYILIGDIEKPDAGEAVSGLRKIGIERIEMLTGDNRCAAEKTAKLLGIDAFHAELLPEDKVRIVEEIKSAANHGGKLAFVGDGINDAPVIARADVGVAMGALGSDAAIETADVVLMTDSPLKIVEAIKIAKQTRKVVWQNIVLALSIKGLFVVLGAIGMASMWEAVFADMGVSLAAVVNSTRMLGAKPWKL